MLILSRKVGEEIIIDNHTKVTVLGVSGSRIRLGIEAPKHVPVLRGELERKLEVPSDLADEAMSLPTNRLVVGGYL